MAQPELLQRQHPPGCAPALAGRNSTPLHRLDRRPPAPGHPALHRPRPAPGRPSAGPLQPGHEGYAQLVLDAPVFALPGDRVIVRNAQASRTLGRAMVLDPDAPARKRRSPQRQATWQALEHWLAAGDTGPLLAQARFGLPLSHLQRLCGQRRPPVPPEPAAHPPAQGDTLLLHPDNWQALQTQLLEALAQFHQQQPDEPGTDTRPPAAHRLARRGPHRSQHQALWRALVAQLSAHRSIAGRRGLAAPAQPPRAAHRAGSRPGRTTAAAHCRRPVRPALGA